MSETDVTKMKVAELKRELKSRGLSTVGNKTELQDRLQSAQLEGDAVLDDSVISEEILDDDGLIDDDLDDDTKSLLECNEDAILKSPQAEISESALPVLPPVKKIILKRNLSAAANDAKETKDDLEESADPEKKIKLSDDITPSITTVTTTESPPESDDSNVKKVIKLSELSLKERLEMRAKKFGGSVAPDFKKLARAERFGLSSDSNDISTEIAAPSTEILKKRAERFGVSVSSSMVKLENQEKLNKRKERFGMNDSKPAVDYSEKARQRLERFKTTTA